MFVLIELKMSMLWTLDQYIEALEKQLVGQCMRHRKATTGLRARSRARRMNQRPFGPSDHHMAHMRPVHLGLFSGQRAKSQVGLGHRLGAQWCHQMAEMRAAAAIPAFLNHDVQATGRQGRELGQRLLDEWHEGVNQSWRLGRWRAQHAGDGQYTPHGVAVKMQLTGNGADSPVLGQVQTQDLRAKFRGDNHYASTCCGAQSPGGDQRWAW
jgi:hypothetical protein